MKNNNRLYNLLAAGTITALLLVTFLLFRSSQLGTVATAAASALTGTTPSESIMNTANPALDREPVTSAQVDTTQAQELATLRAQNAKLLQMLQVMQERERQYQSQLNAASQALQATQAQAGTQGYEEYEQSENEREEYEEHEGFGEHGHHD